MNMCDFMFTMYICIYVCMWSLMCHGTFLKVGNSQWQMIASFYFVGSRDQTDVVKHVTEGLFLLSLLIALILPLPQYKQLSS